jgi:hypothetical protein
MLRSTRIRNLFLSTCVLGAGFFGFGASLAHAFELVLAPDNISSAEQPVIQAFVNDAATKLPPSFKNALTHPITIRFVTTLDSTTTLWVPPCNGESETAEIAISGTTAQIRGQVVRKGAMQDSDIHAISLNALLKTAILAGPAHSQSYGCGHHSMYALAEATLLHELSHLYDFSDDSSLERDQIIDTCMLSGHKPTAPTAGCPDPQIFNRSVSHNPTFESIMSWDGKEFRNQLHSRSPDPYEFTDLEESFAVNMEYFLLDSEYACRRPSEFDYLKDYFGGFDPYPSRNCTLNTKLTLSSSSTDDPGAQVDLDPSRIYQIHFLLAGKGDEVDSAFGHAMFRIILCAPTRKEVGPDCLKDISNHVIVSYRANPGDWNTDAWKGLTGQYPSQLFLLPFYPQIVNEYTLDEPRDLISLPLKFTPEEQTRFIQRVVEQFWTYQGKYYFLTNNCGTEALHLLKATLRIPGFQDSGAPTPIGLYHQMSDLGLIDPTLLNNQSTAETSGYYFPSTNVIFDEAFKRLQSADPSNSLTNFPYKTLQDYVTKSTPQQRVALYQSLKTKVAASDVKGLADRFFILESYIFLQARTKYMADLSNAIQNATGDVHQQFEKLMELERETSPLSGSDAGYGVPEAADFSAPPAANDPATLAEIKSLNDAVTQWSQTALNAETAENEALAQSRSYFLAEISRK